MAVERRYRSLRLARTHRRLRSGLAQLAGALVGLVTGLVVISLPLTPGVSASRTFDVLLGVGFAVIGVASVVFALLFLVVQWASSALSPRLPLFRNDPAVWRSFAYIVAVFVFCMTAALGIAGDEQVSVFIPAAAIVFTLLVLALLLRVQTKAFTSIELAPALDTITRRGNQTLSALALVGHPDDSDDPVGPGTAVRWDGASAVIQTLDMIRLVRAARRADVVIVMEHGIGARLVSGAVVARVHGGPIPAREVLHRVLTSDERSFRQDALFPFRLLADIAMRALSPAVNDPATAAQVLDRLEELLIVAGGVRHGRGRARDADGRVRVIVPLPTWEDYVGTGIDEMIHYAAASPMTTRRLADLLTTLTERVPDELRPALEPRRVRVAAHLRAQT